MAEIMAPLHVIGGGLAGTEAAWQIAQAGIPVALHEMRPLERSPAHHTEHLAELVCSNSFGAQASDRASGQAWCRGFGRMPASQDLEQPAVLVRLTGNPHIPAKASGDPVFC